MSWFRSTFAVMAFAAAIAWGLSYFLVFRFTLPWAGGADYLEVSAMAGRLALNASVGDPTGNPGWSAAVTPISIMKERTREMRRFGIDMPMPDAYPKFAWSSHTFTHPARGWTWKVSTWAVPLWLPTITLGLWPLVSLALYLRKRYCNPHRCRRCGYDLRASVSPTCPECGARRRPTPGTTTPPTL